MKGRLQGSEAHVVIACRVDVNLVATLHHCAVRPRLELNQGMQRHREFCHLHHVICCQAITISKACMLLIHVGVAVSYVRPCIPGNSPDKPVIVGKGSRRLPPFT
jgi:hypothetical protein